MDTVPLTALWSLAVTEGSISGSAEGAASSAAGMAVGMAVGAAGGAAAGAGLQAANTRTAGNVHASVFCFTLMALSSILACTRPTVVSPRHTQAGQQSDLACMRVE
jgi:hypothetical protein